MPFTNKQHELFGLLIKKKANKMVLLMIMSETESWEDENIQTLIDVASMESSTPTDVVNKYLHISKKYPSADENEEIEKKQDDSKRIQINKK